MEDASKWDTGIEMVSASIMFEYSAVPVCVILLSGTTNHRNISRKDHTVHLMNYRICHSVNLSRTSRNAVIHIEEKF